MMKVESKTILFLLFLQIYFVNGQWNGAPPFLYQLLFGGLNPGVQQQQPQIPFLNLLQLLRPSTLNIPAGAQSDTPANTQPPIVSNGVIPFLLNGFLQNIRQPPTGSGVIGPGAAAPGAVGPGVVGPGTASGGGDMPANQPSPQVPILPNPAAIVPLFFQQLLQNIRQPSGMQQNNLALGTSSDPIPETVTPSSNDNANTNVPIWTPENIAALQQLFQGANAQLLLGLTQLPTSGVPPAQQMVPTQVGTSNGAIGNIPFVQAGTSNIIPNNNLISLLASQPLPSAQKPVTEISNDIMKTTESPLMPLAPVKPQNPTVLSYVPYTTTIKPPTANGGSENLSQTGPQSFNTGISPFSVTRPTTERSTTFVPLFFERKETVPSFSSTRKNPLVDNESDINIDFSTQHSKLSSKFITSVGSVGSVVGVDEVVTSPTLFFNNKRKQSQGIKVSQNNAGIKITENDDKIKSSTELPLKQSSTDNESPSLGSENLIKLNDEKPVSAGVSIVGSNALQNDELPSITVQNNAHFNRDTPNANHFGLNPFLNYPFSSGPTTQGFAYQPSLMNYPVNLNLQNQYPITLTNGVQSDASVYENVPHFAYANPYSNLIFYCPPAYYRNLPLIQVEQPYKGL